MTATIDGGSFSAVAIAAAYSGGIMGLGGTDSQGRTIGIGGQITAPGTYPIGPTSSANFSLTIGSASWQAAITVGSGTLTVTSISATGAKGTFQFVAGPVPGTTSSGNRNVTQGAFDVTF